MQVESIGLVVKWWKTWRTLPVFAWVKAAAMYRQGKFVDAERLYRKGLRTSHSHPAQYCARLDLSYCLFRMGKLEAAEEELQKVVAMLPNSREAQLRLARLQLWRGESLQAAWTMRRALRNLAPDVEMASLFLGAAIDARAPKYLLEEALRTLQSVQTDDDSDVRAKAFVARAQMIMRRPGTPEHQLARTQLAQVASRPGAPFECVIAFGEVLIEEGKVALARRLLRRALHASSEYPRLLSLLAETYLRSGTFYNADYARQLATTACQKTSWTSPREMHILAEAFYHCGDKISALVVASRAKELGSKLLGSYTHSRTLDDLISNLSSGTQA
ncbi:MAG: tetratricopeptide repeat protein [Oligoflexia bacterium]|nr:tetratricopeptide repeat protein [Oligoflexia bacterium]